MEQIHPYKKQHLVGKLGAFTVWELVLERKSSEEVNLFLSWIRCVPR